MFHVEHCKCFTWNIVSVSRGTSQAFHVEHQRRTGEDGKRGERQTTTQRGRSAHRRGRQERRAPDDDAERAKRAQARTAREARRPKPQTGKLAAKRQATGRPNAAKASGFLKGAALMRSKSGPDKNRRQSKEGQGAKPIAASKPIKAEDRSDAERSRPQPSTQARTRRRKKRRRTQPPTACAPLVFHVERLRCST